MALPKTVTQSDHQRGGFPGCCPRTGGPTGKDTRDEVNTTTTRKKVTNPADTTARKEPQATTTRTTQRTGPDESGRWPTAEQTAAQEGSALTIERADELVAPAVAAAPAPTPELIELLARLLGYR